MRIDLNTRTPELSESTSSSSQPAIRQSPSEANSEDQATLSSSARVPSLELQVRQLPEIRQTRVLALGRAIRDGQYHVHSDQIAGSMLSETMRSGLSR
jgi:flagellar biosynthesis anti-sigma factor FlgM